MPIIADTVLVNGQPQNGAVVNAYKASRFSSTPIDNSAPPAGGVDAGPVTSGTTFGGPGEFQITTPTTEDYYCSATYTLPSGLSHTSWQRYAMFSATGLPSGGSVGQAVINTGPGAGSWQGDTAWTAPTLGNSWANVAGWSTAGFRKDANGFVHLRGRLSGGAANTSPFTLPAGYRPGSGTAALPSLGTDGSDGTGVAVGVAVSTAGVVTLDFTSVGKARVTLDGITFYAEN